MEILHVRLLARDIPALRAFYGELLGLALVEEGLDHLCYQAGTSQLEFRGGAPLDRGTAYHVAFEIPENQLAAAKAWLQTKVSLVPGERGTTEFYFEAWDAHSAYFRDPDGNIMEVIARHRSGNATESAFDATSILSISEVGVPVAQVMETIATLVSDVGLAVYSRFADGRSAAVGDERGLLIVVERGRIWFPSTGAAAGSAAVEVVFRQAQDSCFEISSGPAGCSVERRRCSAGHGH